MDKAQVFHPGDPIRLAWLGGADDVLSDVKETLSAVKSSRLHWVPPEEADVFLTAIWPPDLTAPLPSGPVVLVSDAPVYHPAVTWQPHGRDVGVLVKTIVGALSSFQQDHKPRLKVLRARSAFLESDALKASAAALSSLYSETSLRPVRGAGAEKRVEGFRLSETLHAWAQRAADFAREASSNIRLTGLDYEFVALAGGRQFYVDATVAELLSNAGETYADSGLSLEVDSHELMVNEGDTRLHRADTLLWCLASHTSNGRWPDELNVESRFCLRSWPDAVQWDVTYEQMQVFAEWHGQSLSLVELLARTGLPNHDISDLVVACVAMGLGEEESHTSSTDVSQGRARPKNRRFWRRGG